MKLFVIAFVLGAFGHCDPAESKTVPADFGMDNFNSITAYAQRQHIDPQSIDIGRCYVGASEAALAVLPRPLMLMSRGYYENRDKIKSADEIIPGRAIQIPGRTRFLIFEPDYKKLKEIARARRKRENKANKGLSLTERSKKFKSLMEKSKIEKRKAEKLWKKVLYTRKDFVTVIEWIRKNKGKYQTPPNGEKDSRYAKEPMGMQHVLFDATNGFLSSMDPHSAIIDRKSWDKMLSESQDSSFEGIGAILKGGGTRDVIVETPLPGSPAVNAGLKAGDIIRKVDGKPIDTLPLSLVVKKIRGKRETIVELYVERPLELRSMPIRIKRGVIKLKAVSSKYLKRERIGVIKISSFLYRNEHPSRQVRKEYESLVRKSKNRLKGLVIDLRNNPGGDLEEAINTTGLFLPEDVPVVQIRSRGKNDIRKNPGMPMLPFKGNRPKIPVIALINAGSASASEILASAIMDHDVALVIGERTFGKASVQRLEGFGPSIVLKLTTARYYAPNGYTIQVRGVYPDVKVSDEPDGTFPARFREEDMWKHLPELEKRKSSDRHQKWVEALKKKVGDNAQAEAYLKKHRKDAIKPDYLLRRALAYLNAMRRMPLR